MTATLIPPARRGTGALRLLVGVALAAMVGGCMASQQVSGTLPTDYRNRHPIVLREGPRTLELLIGDRRGTLNGSQRAEVMAFAREWGREGTGGVLIDLPSGSSNEIAAANAVHEVRAMMLAAGVPPDAVSLRPQRRGDPARLATLRLHYPRVVAEAGPCGLWPHDLGATYEREHLENRQYWNLGCAAQRNLAAMVENPHDLIQPRGETPSYTGRRTTVLDKYHRGESTTTVYTNTDKGVISDVGK